MARLMEQLINEGKKDKAKKVIEEALTKMPMDYYGYYTMVEPFASGYYEIGEKAKAREVLERLMTKYKQSLTYFSNIQPSIQNGIVTDIITDIERYRSLLMVMKDHDDLEFYNKNKAIFNSFNKRLARFGRDME
jgi:tetratricopeptide (TPR) repeat protein